MKLEKAGSVKYSRFQFHEYVACIVLRPVADNFRRFYFRKCRLHVIREMLKINPL